MREIVASEKQGERENKRDGSRGVYNITYMTDVQRVICNFFVPLPPTWTPNDHRKTHEYGTQEIRKYMGPKIAIRKKRHVFRDTQYPKLSNFCWTSLIYYNYYYYNGGETANNCNNNNDRACRQRSLAAIKSPWLITQSADPWKWILFLPTEFVYKANVFKLVIKCHCAVGITTL